MKAEELLPCWCSWDLKTRQGSKHKQDCPAYYRSPVAAKLRELMDVIKLFHGGE